MKQDSGLLLDRLARWHQASDLADRKPSIDWLVATWYPGVTRAQRLAAAIEALERAGVLDQTDYRYVYNRKGQFDP